jgi:hypothetical protein
MMRLIIRLLLLGSLVGACPAGVLSAQDEKGDAALGVIKLAFTEGKEVVPHLSVHVLRAMDAASEASLQADFSSMGLIVNLEEILDKRYPEAKVNEVKKVEAENRVTLTLNPGIYHVLVRQGKTSGVWLTDLKVAAGETLERPVTLSKPGSVRGTWSIDSDSGRAVVPGTQTTGSLFRDGRVWAVTQTDKKHTLAVSEVPPGKYTLVVTDFMEGYTSITDNVVVSSDKETPVKLTIKFEKLVYLIGRFKNKKTQADIPADDFQQVRIALIEGKHGIPLGTNYSSIGQSGQKLGWLRIPADSSYTLSMVLPKYKPLEKLTVKPNRYTDKPDIDWDRRAEVQPFYLTPGN